MPQQPKNLTPPTTGWHRNTPRSTPDPVQGPPLALPDGTSVRYDPDIDARHQYACDLYATDPYAFALEMFEWSKPYSFLAKREQPYEWQCEVLQDCTERLKADPSIYRLAIASGKGIGKTALLAQFFLWHITTHRHSQTNLLDGECNAYESTACVTSGRRNQSLDATLHLLCVFGITEPFVQQSKPSQTTHGYAVRLVKSRD